MSSPENSRTDSANAAPVKIAESGHKTAAVPSPVIMITGALGYVGGRVSHHLALNSNLPLRLTSRQPPSSKPTWLSRGEIIAWDATQRELPPLDDVDTIIHLASVNEIECARDPLFALEVNGHSTLRLLQAAQDRGVRRFIYFSTAHAYGAPLAGEISEATSARPLHPYAITHRVAEDFVLAATAQSKIEGIVLRLSNGLGAPLTPEVNRWTLVANDLCRQAVTNGKLVLKSSGLQQRDFIALRDVARCVDHMITLPSQSIHDGLFNLGGGRTMSILEMAQLIAARCEAVLGFCPPLERPDVPSEDSLPELVFLIEKLKSTGFAIQNDLEAEIDDTLKLCAENFK